MTLAFGALLAGLFIGWWSGVLTAACCTHACARAEEEARFLGESGA